jgi:transposase
LSLSRYIFPANKVFSVRPRCEHAFDLKCKGKGSNVEKDALELLLSQGLSLAQIGKRFGKDPSTVSYWMEKYGLDAVHREKHAAKGGIDRGRLVEVVEAGMTIAEIAGELGLSKGTVRHWLGRYGLKTQHAVGRRPAELARAAKDAGRLTVTMPCRHHGETEFYLEGRGYYRCKRCRSEAVTRRRRKLKAVLVDEAGGRCCLCGYDRCSAALSFHHVDPLLKRMPISAGGIAYAIEFLRAEAQKCVLVCANCHAEIESGVAVVPIQYGREQTPPSRVARRSTPG